MTDVLQLGPLALPYGLVTTIVSLALGAFVGTRVARQRGVDADAFLLRMLLIGVVAARVAFVLEWRAQYIAQPATLLDIRDGGWDVQAGIVAALAFGLWRARGGAMRRPAIAAGLVSTLLLALSGAGLAILAPDIVVPDVTVAALDGRPVGLREFVGKPTVMNLWATWCPPCRRELPVLAQAQAENDDINLLFIDQGQSAQVVASFLERQSLTLHHVLLDSGPVGSRLGHGALPTTLFFDAGGHLVASHVGPLSAATLAERLAQLRRHVHDGPSVTQARP